MNDVKFDIIEICGVLSQTKNWNKELNKVSWGGRPAKYDLRCWDDEHTKMQKGVTLTRDELIALRDLLNNLDLSKEITNIKQNDNNTFEKEHVFEIEFDNNELDDLII